ncbi:MAG: transcription termination factor Rho [Phycisphaerales bacterium]|nr:transcription termination factor Rho [Phycisphaerales bacterium]
MHTPSKQQRRGPRRRHRGNGRSDRPQGQQNQPNQQRRRQNHHNHNGHHQPSAGNSAVLSIQVDPNAPIVTGVLQQLDPRKEGQLREDDQLLRPVKGNITVPRELIAHHQLKTGLLLQGPIKGTRLVRIDSIEGQSIDDWLSKTTLYDQTPLDPQPALRLEHSPSEYTTRVIDLLAPVGFGQRGLIVAPPRTGKTILLQNLARGIHHNYPEAELILLLIDERPEEVTDMRRNVPGKVWASSNDNTVDKHLDLAQLAIERCKRKVEYGANVIVLLDSLTRLGRAFNTGTRGGGRTMSGGLDNRALEIPKKLFGAARKIENGGSLTIIATCLIDTGSRMDQVIFEEFKGTGNMELTLDRALANLRIFPALNITESGTRKEEKLMSEKELAQSRQIRRHLLNMPAAQSMKTLLDVLAKFHTNAYLLSTIRVG